mmetsp:Transcript_14369/g.43393  ORF Transcript_14369/g.43393 Transcript_14369/m.43393 type:complete len:302 (+) Transcript_14369:1525-2430(+)
MDGVQSARAREATEHDSAHGCLCPHKLPSVFGCSSGPAGSGGFGFAAGRLAFVGEGAGGLAPLQEGVLQGLLGSDPLLGVQYQHLLQQVRQRLFMPLVPIALLQTLWDISRNFWIADQATNNAFGQRVFFEEFEAHGRVVIEVLARECPLAQHLLWKRALDVHHDLQHLVVGAARKEDLAGEKLVQDTSHAPHVHRIVVGQAKNDLRGPVKARNQVRSDAVVARKHRRSEVTDLDGVVAGIDENVVGLDVCVQHAVVVHVVQRCQHLLAEQLHCGQADAHIARHLACQLPQIHCHGLEHQA